MYYNNVVVVQGSMYSIYAVCVAWRGPRYASVPLRAVAGVICARCVSQAALAWHGRALVYRALACRKGCPKV